MCPASRGRIVMAGGCQGFGAPAGCRQTQPTLRNSTVVSRIAQRFLTQHMGATPPDNDVEAGPRVGGRISAPPVFEGLNP